MRFIPKSALPFSLLSKPVAQMAPSRRGPPDFLRFVEKHVRQEAYRQEKMGGTSYHGRPIHPRACSQKMPPPSRAASLRRECPPKGPGSGMRMLTYFINRGGRNLTASRRRELEKAKELLSERVEHKKPKRAKPA
jgi:hypothetical protein